MRPPIDARLEDLDALTLMYLHVGTRSHAKLSCRARYGGGSVSIVMDKVKLSAAASITLGK
jgi:hypothetical protein